MTSFAISTPQLNLLLLLCGKWTKLRLELELRGCCFSAAAAGEGREEFIQQGPAMLVVPVQVTLKNCHVSEQTNTLVVGSRGQPGERGQAFWIHCFHYSEEEARWAGWNAPSGEVPLDVESRSALVHSGFLLDWLAMDAWTEGAVWGAVALGRYGFSWQLLLGLTEEQWCLGIRNSFF